MSNQDSLNAMLDLYYKEGLTQEEVDKANSLWDNLKSIPLSVALTMGAMLDELNTKEVI